MIVNFDAYEQRTYPFEDSVQILRGEAVINQFNEASVRQAIQELSDKLFSFQISAMKFGNAQDWNSHVGAEYCNAHCLQ